MNKTVKKAYAKINLSLDVVGRRENGYHEVDMIMQSIELHDVLTFEKTTGEISVICTNRSDLSCGEDNLIYKAIVRMKERYKFAGGVRVLLEKNIPVAAGMAGGSTDCAATLRAVNELWELGLSEKELCEVGVTLGADVPFCILEGTARATGIGENLEKLPCRIAPAVVLIKPAQGASTKEVYTAFDACHDVVHPQVEEMVKALETGDATTCCTLLGNVLQPVTEGFLPVIGSLCAEMMENGADGALMSGSGPTVFGLFGSKEKALRAKEKLAAKYPEFFTCVTGFRTKEEA